MDHLQDSLARVGSRLSALNAEITNVSALVANATGALQTKFAAQESQIGRLKAVYSELRRRLWLLADKYGEFEIQASSVYIQNQIIALLSKQSFTHFTINRVIALPSTTENPNLTCIQDLLADVVDLLIEGTYAFGGTDLPLQVHLGLFVSFDKALQPGDTGVVSVLHKPHLCGTTLLSKSLLEPLLFTIEAQIEQALQARPVPASIPTHLPASWPSWSGTSLNAYCVRRSKGYASMIGDFPVYTSDVVQEVAGIPPMRNDLQSFRLASNIPDGVDVCVRVSTLSIAFIARGYMPAQQYDGQDFVSPPGFTVMVDPNDSTQKILVAGITAAAFAQVCSDFHLFPLTNMHCDYSTLTLKLPMTFLARFKARVDQGSGFVDVEMSQAWDNKMLKTLTIPLGTGIKSVSTDVSADAISAYITFAQ